MTRRLAPAACAAAIALLVSACSSAPAALPADEYHELAGELLPGSAAELDGYADEICGVMREGDSDSSWLLGVKYLTDLGMDARDAGEFLVYAASYRCTDLLERFPDA